MKVHYKDSNRIIGDVE